MKEEKKLPSGGTSIEGLSGLQSEKSSERLEQIASLRARGISKNIDLPQLVVCGDQSAGKSSVLEGISSIPFPRADGVCTKFPTEVILEHSDEQESITASIIPHESRSDVSKRTLQAFNSSITDYSELPDVIGTAGELMGLRGYGANESGPAFAEDVLRIKVVGRTGLHISIVDLPGLIATASEEQTQADVNTVHRMVDSYIEKPRTIILAIVQASNDIANQSIIRKSKAFDKPGQRTVGVITKSDLINKGTEGRIALLAKNLDTTKLELGYYILKNPTPSEMEEGSTAKQRSANELRFFQSSPWKEHNLDATRVGIDKLRDFLQTILDRHVEKELPKVREEIRTMIKTTERDVANLPAERPTVAHLRMYLSQLAMKYHNLSAAALHGDYHTSHQKFFAAAGDKVGKTRLRALVHTANTSFAARVRDQGKMLILTTDKSLLRQSADSSNGSDDASDEDEDEDEDGDEVEDHVEDMSEDEDEDENEDGPIYVDEGRMKAWVKQTYMKTRGRELPGNYNHVLLTELFHRQSKRWPRLAQDHVDAVADHIQTFVHRAMKYVRMEDYVRAEIQEGIKLKLQEDRANAEDELAKLCADEEAQPITYNHYYTDNVQKSRISSFEKVIDGAMGKMGGDSQSVNSTVGSIKNLLNKGLVVDMDEQACSEALADLDAYYKVALKTFVDNVCRQVVERHLLRNLPKIFAPEDVAGYEDEKLQRIAGERHDVVVKRKELQEQLETLKAGLNDLRK